MKYSFIFITIPKWIIILMPALLISGPFLSDLGVSIVAILFIINSKKNYLIKYYNNYYFKFFFIFCSILILSSFFSKDIILSLKTSLFYFRFGIFTLCFWYLLDINKFILKNLFISILICFTFLLVDGYIQYIFGENLFGYKLHNEYRVSSLFGSEYILGSYLARFFPILFGLFIFLNKFKKKKSTLYILTVIFVLIEGLIFLSGERLALFFLNLSAVFMILMLKKFRTYRFWTYFVSLFFIFGLMIFFPNAKNRLIDQTINDFTRNTLNNTSTLDDKIYLFSKPHTDMYISAYRIFLDNKFFGVGPRQYRNVCKDYRVSEYSCHTHPHNTYLELLAESGFFAFGIVAGLFIFIMYISFKHFTFKFTKNKKTIFNDFEVCLLSAIIISLWPFSPSGSFFNNWMSIVYYYPLGILLWQRSSYKNLKITR